jgi:hypothetical protein
LLLVCYNMVGGVVVVGWGGGLGGWRIVELESDGRRRRI